MDVDLRTLDYLAATARAGSFAAAARSLGLTQPSISRPVRKLERKLGVSLFAASGGHRLTLTEAGKALLEGVDQLSQKVTEICQRAADVGQVPTGKLILAAPPAIGQALLAHVVPEFIKRYPKVQLQVVQSYSAYIEDWLREGRVDLGLYYGKPRTTEIETSPLLTMDMYLAVSATKSANLVDPAPKQREVPLSALGDVPLILPGHPSGIRHLVDQAAEKLKIRLNVVLEVDHQPLLRKLVAAGMAYSVIAFDGVREEVAAGSIRVIPFKSPGLSWPVSIARSSERYPSLASVAMSDLLRSTAQRLIAKKMMVGKIS